MQTGEEHLSKWESTSEAGQPKQAGEACWTEQEGVAIPAKQEVKQAGPSRPRCTGGGPGLDQPGR